MKKPNKLYRQLGGSRTLAGATFAAVHHPRKSLRSAFAAVRRKSLREVFGFNDPAGRDAAENFAGMDASKRGFQLVFAVLAKWNAPYKGKMSGLMSLLHLKR